MKGRPGVSKDDGSYPNNCLPPGTTILGEVFYPTVWDGGPVLRSRSSKPPQSRIKTKGVH